MSMIGAGTQQAKAMLSPGMRARRPRSQERQRVIWNHVDRLPARSYG